MTNINDLLRDHVTLDVECVDRLYLNGYIPLLQTGGQLVTFIREHLKQPIPSPAVLGKITERFRDNVQRFAQEQAVPLIHFQSGQRKDDLANDLRRKSGGQVGVVFIGVAQEKAQAFSARQKEPKEKSSYVGFEYSRDKTVYVNHYYFYLEDEEFGPAFLKVCSYAPWGIKICLNGHEWVKRQLEKRGIAYRALDNGFLSCDKPEELQKICDALGPQHVEEFLRRWLERLPLPLGPSNREAGYTWQLSIWQMEVSRTQVFDHAVHGREFFEEVIRDNLDLGRPDRVQLIFDRRIIKTTPGRFRTRIVEHGVHPSLHIEYKSFDLKQYYKEGRALRTEGTFKDSKDFGINKGLRNFSSLRELGKQINRRLLDVQRVSHNCGLSGESIESVVRPTVSEDGQRAPGLRLGDPRVMALFLALCLFGHVINGFHHRDLRKTVANLLGIDEAEYSPGKMTYDLRRLRLKGIICREPDRHRYFVTSYGWKMAHLFSRLEACVFRPACTAFQNQEAALPPKLCQSLRKVDEQLDALIYSAHITQIAA